MRPCSRPSPINEFSRTLLSRIFILQRFSSCGMSVFYEKRNAFKFSKCGQKNAIVV